ncbi:MAG: DUF547 domain-containing protein [Desulfobacterales bacterium]
MFGALRFIMLSAIFFAFSAAVVSGNKGTVESVFQPYADLLNRFLIERDLENDGLESAFDYEKALAHEQTMALLEEQDALLAEFDVAQLDTLEKAVAFWSNAYNYFMIAHILRERPDDELVESIWDYGGRFSPFRANIFERDLFTIGKHKYSLNDMEKSILLGDEFAEKGWKEARVHFTVNCASVGCPPLRRQIYTAENIDKLMTENTRRALNTHRHLHREGNTLYISELFKWYEDDYVEEEGSVKEFIKAYADDHVAEKVEASTRIHYIDYDWSLNKPGNFPGFEEALGDRSGF